MDAIIEKWNRSLSTGIDEDRPESATWIYTDLYNPLKDQARKSRYHIKAYINALLDSSLTRMAYLKKHYPEMSFQIDLGLKDTVTLVEGSVNIIIKVKDGRLHCSKDNSFDCRHVEYAMLHPITAQILKKESGRT